MSRAFTTPTTAGRSSGGGDLEPGAPSSSQADGSTQVAVLPSGNPESQATIGAGDSLWGVIFAGGIGSRFWPLSSPDRPKQLLPLVDDRPLIADTLRRFREIIPAQRTIVMTSRDIAGAIHAAIPDVPSANMLAEPAPMGTAASLAWAVSEIKRRAGPNAVVCASHADIAVSLVALFHDALLTAVAAARGSERIVLLGVEPTRPEPGFGYIVPADHARAKSFANAHTVVPATTRHAPVRRFLEKPLLSEAEGLIGKGALWHSGVFVGSVRTIQQQLRERTPEVEQLVTAISTHEVERIANSGRVESISLEKGLFERSDQLSVVRGEFTWDDVGTWASLRRARDLDDAGNGIVGAAHLVDASANIVHTETGATVVYGVDDLLVVRLKGLTFVTTLERARDLRPLLDLLPEELRRRMTE